MSETRTGRTITDAQARAYAMALLESKRRRLAEQKELRLQGKLKKEKESRSCSRMTGSDTACPELQ